MERRDFFGWMGKISMAIGLGYLTGKSQEIDNFYPQQYYPPERMGDYRLRMNGRACHDYRMISGDRSMRLDKDIFYN